MRGRANPVLDGPEVFRAGPVFEYDIEDLALNATIQVTTGRQRPRRYEVRNAMIERGVSSDTIGAVYQQRRTDVWFVQLNSVAAAQHFCNVYASIPFGDSIWGVQLHNSETINIKCHWMPAYIKASWYKRFFSAYGEVKNVYREEEIMADDGHIFTGAVHVVLETGVKARQKIPHLVKTEEEHVMLITFKGRPPLCLECGVKGHVRVSCPVLRERMRQQAIQRSGEAAIISGLINDRIRETPHNEDASSVSSSVSRAPVAPEPPLAQRPPAVRAVADEQSVSETGAASVATGILPLYSDITKANDSQFEMARATGVSFAFEEEGFDLEGESDELVIDMDVNTSLGSEGPHLIEGASVDNGEWVLPAGQRQSRRLGRNLSKSPSKISSKRDRSASQNASVKKKDTGKDFSKAPSSFVDGKDSDAG